MNHLSYETSVKLAKFLGKTILVPIDKKYWAKSHYYTEPALTENINLTCHDYYPAFTLEDILSKLFCEALALKLNNKWHSDGISEMLWGTYYFGGFPATEREILRLMEGK